MERRRLSELTSKLQSGDGIPASKIKTAGLYPVFGGNGLRGFTDSYNEDGSFFFIGRQGAKCGNVHYHVGKAYMTEHAVVGIASADNDAIYLAYKLSLLNLGKLQGQSAQPGLAVGTLANVEIDVPSSLEQKKIGKLLYRLDQKIALNTRMNAELEAMAKQLYDYWFVQFDFPDENGNPYKSSGGKMVYNSTLKREIPAGWEVKSLNQLAQTPKESINPFENPERDYKHYSIPAFDACGSYLVEKGEVIQSNKFIVNKGQILVPKLNPWYNRVILVDSNEYSICSTEFVILDAIEDYVKGFLFYTVKTDNFISYCTKGSTGTSHSQRRVPPEILKAYNVPYNKDVVSSFTACVMQQLSMINRNMNEIKQLTHLRDSLLPMLMNGQVTVE